MDSSIIPFVCFLEVLHFIPSFCFYIQPDVLTFTESPQSQIVLINSSLVMKCALDLNSFDLSLPLPDITWQFNDQNLTSCSSGTVLYQNSMLVSECTLYSVSPEGNTGWYKCVAVDGKKNCSSPPACYPTITASSAAYVLVQGETVDTNIIEVDSNCSSVLLMPFDLSYYLLTNITVDFDYFRWEKDGSPIDGIVDIQILSSGSLFISKVLTQFLGTYTCKAGNESGMIIKQYSVQLNELAAKELPSVDITILHSFSTSSSSQYSLLADNDIVGLVCHRTNVCSDASVVWMYNGTQLKNESGQDLLRYESFAPGNYCCSVDKFSDCTTITEIVPSSENSSTLYLNLKTVNASEVTTVSLNCTSQTDNEVEWLYNGDRLMLSSDSSSIDEQYTVRASSLNASSVIGIYQCFLINSSVSALYTYRLLPYGLTNPPSSVSIAIYPPSIVGYGVHTITCVAPLYTGGLNATNLNYKVSVETFNVLASDSPPDCVKMVFETCIISCQVDFYEKKDVYREFNVHVVDFDGDFISQSSKQEISAFECDVYSPVPPTTTLLCAEENTTLVWKKSNMTFFPEEELTIVELICFSGNTTVEEHSTMADTNIQSSAIQLVESLSIGDVCSLTAYGTSLHCTGSMSVDRCTVTQKPLIISSTLHSVLISPSITPDVSLPLDISSLHINLISSSIQFFSQSSSSLPSSTVSSSVPVTKNISKNSVSSSSATHSNNNSSVSFKIETSASTNGESTNVLLISLLAVFGVVMITMFGCIICITSLFGYNSWKKRSIDNLIIIPPGDEPSVGEMVLHEEDDVISIVTNIESLVMLENDHQHITKNIPLVSVPEVEDSDDTTNNLSFSNGIVHYDHSTISLTPLPQPSSLQDTSSVSSGSRRGCYSKTSDYGYSSDTSHKTSAYSSTSESSSSGYSDFSPDYVDHSAYSKHFKTPISRSAVIQILHSGAVDDEEGDDGGTEMRVLYPRETNFSPISEQAEDEFIGDSHLQYTTTELQHHHNNTKLLEHMYTDHDNISNVSSSCDEDNVDYENMSSKPSSDDFVRSSSKRSNNSMHYHVNDNALSTNEKHTSHSLV